jgi:hypothetical protein
MDTIFHKVIVLAVVLAGWSGHAQERAADPFTDVTVTPLPATNAPAITQPSWGDNLLLRKEVYLLFALGAQDVNETHDAMTRASLGFEIQKRFATATRTIASFDYQGRIVYRNHSLDLLADPMARDAGAWEYETHNAYADIYNVFSEPGRFNLRVGHFYQPFGLNQQTDTHGTLLQLSNDQLFGKERDWQATLFGSLTDDLDYWVGYLLGTGENFEMAGQTGMGVARIGLNNSWLFDEGLEGGLSVAAGERVDEHAMMRSHSVMKQTGGDPVIRTWRAGLDVRQRIDSEIGPFTPGIEAAIGGDEQDLLFSGLTQVDWLSPNRHWGAATQFRYFWQDAHTESGGTGLTDSRATLVLTRYFQNDVGNAALHWIALAVEQQVYQTDGPEDTRVMLQYYRYW